VEKFIQSTNKEFIAHNLPMRVDSLTTVWTVLFNQPGRYHWMFQYYLRAEGLALSWVGTGRCLFSLDFTDAQYEQTKVIFPPCMHDAIYLSIYAYISLFLIVYAMEHTFFYFLYDLWLHQYNHTTKKKQHALLRAGVKMQQDGWWWKGTDEQPLTASTIQNQMSKEILGALFGMRK
jgi:hypothetical protein